MASQSPKESPMTQTLDREAVARIISGAPFPSKRAFAKADAILALLQPSPHERLDDISMILERMLEGDTPEKFVDHFAREIIATLGQSHESN
jgi:hypothetical protein